MNVDKKAQMKKQFEELERMVKDPDAMSFNIQWKKLVRQHGCKTSKVKQSFVKSMIKPVRKMMHWHLYNNNNTDIALEPSFLLEVASIETIVDAIFHYHLFYSGDLSDTERKKNIEESDYKRRLASVVAQTILLRINHMEKQPATSELSPEIVACRELCDAIIYHIHVIAVRDEIYPTAGILEVFHSAFFAAKGVLKLLTAGQGIEAFLLWRNLHEQECILSVFMQYGESALQAYMKQQEFMKVEFDDSEERLRRELGHKFNDETLKDIEFLRKVLNTESKKHGVSKRSYINYGWLLKIEGFVKWCGEDKKSRDVSFTTLQRFAKFPNYKEKRDFYLYACKFTHPTFHSMRVSEKEIYKTCIFALYPSIKNIAYMFQAFCSTHRLFKDENYKSYLEQLSINLNTTYEFLGEKHSVFEEK